MTLAWLIFSLLKANNRISRFVDKMNGTDKI